MLYIRSDLPFKSNKSISTEQREKYRTECIACEVKVGRSWMTIVGIYRPPSLKKRRWEFEMSNLFEMFTFRGNDVLFLGDFNCDMIHPDKAPKDGRCLMDLLDVYHLKNLVTQSTRVTKSSETLIDLILTNNKRRFLQTGVVDTQISDHSLVYSIMRVTLPRLRSRKIAFRSFKNFDRDKFLEDLSAAPFHISYGQGLLLYIDRFVTGQDKLNPNPKWRYLVPLGFPLWTKRVAKMAGYWPPSFIGVFYGPRLRHSQ